MQYMILTTRYHVVGNMFDRSRIEDDRQPTSPVVINRLINSTSTHAGQIRMNTDPPLENARETIVPKGASIFPKPNGRPSGCQIANHDDFTHRRVVYDKPPPTKARPTLLVGMNYYSISCTLGAEHDGDRGGCGGRRVTYGEIT